MVLPKEWVRKIAKMTFCLWTAEKVATCGLSAIRAAADNLTFPPLAILPARSMYFRATCKFAAVSAAAGNFTRQRKHIYLQLRMNDVKSFIYRLQVGYVRFAYCLLWKFIWSTVKIICLACVLLLLIAWKIDCKYKHFYLNVLCIFTWSRRQIYLQPWVSAIAVEVHAFHSRIFLWVSCNFACSFVVRGLQAVLHENRRHVHTRQQAELALVLSINYLRFSDKITRTSDMSHVTLK